MGIHTTRLIELWARLAVAQPSIVLTKPSRNIRITGGPAIAILIGIVGLIVLLVVRYLAVRRQAAVSRINEQRAHEALAQSESRYRLLFENNPCPMWVYDFDTLAFIEVNDNAVEQYGFTREEFLRMTLRDIRENEGAAPLETVIRGTDYGSEGVHLARHKKKDGSIIHVEARGRPLPISNRRLRLVVATDVTERLVADLNVRQAESRARATSDLLRSLIDSAPQAIIMIDTKLSVTAWNRAAESLFGWTEAEVLGGPVPILPPEVRAPAWPAHVETGKPIEVIRLRKDGSRVALLLAAAPAVDSLGAPIGHIAVFTDLTDRKLLEEQLRQSQKMEAVGTLAGGVAHDFNNILTVITSYCSLLLSVDRDPADRADLEEIATAANRASALTRQLLTFTRKAIVQPRPVDVNEVVAGMESMLRRLLTSNIRLETKLRSDGRRVVADPSQIEQIIMNLVVNASDAMPNGGSLVLETQGIELDEAYAQMHSGVVPGPYVMLAISDTGVGMDARTLDKIFEPFFTTKDVGRGTGLGLATVYGIVTQIGGHVWVYSEPEQGATFKIYLPRDPATETADESISTSALRSQRVGTAHGTVLLVEDDDRVRRAVRRMLERVGYDVLEANDGESGLEVAKTYTATIDVVVTDLMMPRMDGRALATALSSVLPNVHIVFTSGYTDDAVLRRGLVNSSHAFLQKPFTGEQLAHTISALINNESTPAQPA